MKLPEVKGEKPTKTALKAYLVLMQEDEAWHKEILSIQKEHKNVLFTLPSGQKLDNMHEDPIIGLERELQYEKQFSNAKTSEPKVIELKSEKAKATTDSVSDDTKKSYGKFSFLGSEDTQKQLVEEFLNRNKKNSENETKEKVEELKQEDEVQQLNKVDEVQELNKVDDVQTNDKQDEEVKGEVNEEVIVNDEENTKITEEPAKDLSENPVEVPSEELAEEPQINDDLKVIY